MMKTLQNKKLFQRVKMENIRKKFHQIIYWIKKKTSPMVFHLNQTVSQIIKMFAKLFNYHAIYNWLKAIVNN